MISVVGYFIPSVSNKFSSQCIYNHCRASCYDGLEKVTIPTNASVNYKEMDLIELIKKGGYCDRKFNVSIKKGN